MIYRLERKQITSLGLEACWSFFSDPRNLAQITPPALKFRLKSEVPGQIYPGLLIEYTVAPLFGIPLTWLSEIVQVEPPHFFADAQRVGPYRLWRHEHFFRVLPEGGTEVRDLVTYVPPLGPLGWVLNRMTIRPQLERIFDYRAAHLPGNQKQAAA